MFRKEDIEQIEQRGSSVQTVIPMDEDRGSGNS